MKHIILFDTEGNHTDLLPMSFTRPVAHFRVGITTIAEKWERCFGAEASYLTPDYLAPKFPVKEEASNLWIAGNTLPEPGLVKSVSELAEGRGYFTSEGGLMAFRGSRAAFESALENPEGTCEEWKGDVRRIIYLYHIFQYNGEALADDFRALTAGRTSCPLSGSNRIIGNPLMDDGTPALFIEEGATVEGATINLTKGPVYIGKDAEVMEGSCIRGPFALCAGSKVNMLTKVYPDCTIGPRCKVGGELNNVVFFGNSNKAHDGYLGNAVIGEWCNIGAGTNASNLKNDYSKIRLWNYRRHTFMRTDLQFCGLIMGDHSKAGINCMFNTATVVGVGCNIHGAGFPRVFIPSFSEGSPASGMSDVPLKKFFDIAARAMSRRNVPLTDGDRMIFERVAKVASQFKYS